VFHVAVDPKEEAVLGALPGANCGGCGFVGCAEYAAAVAKGKTELTLCAPGGAKTARAIADILGVHVDLSLPYRAVVHCSARTPQRLQRKEYFGEPTCAAANLISGVQGCTYGCLGLGDCVRACRFDAIHVIDGLARVDYTKCVGCKACARACPRHIITMVPFKADRILVVGCCNQDMGNDVKAVCEVGCIGCKGCSRIRPDLISMVNNLPVLNYDQYDPDAKDMGPVLGKCPRASLVFVGKPTPEDMAAVANEKLDGPVEADFKTTVDETEWRG
jgi:Na+-translocating ferredoxin:NAD+ oxidoreductase RNF subunit RnfB